MYIAIDIGGTSTRIATSSSLEKIRIEQKVVFKNTGNFLSDISELTKIIDTLTNKKVYGICIGIAGQIEKSSQTLLDLPNLPEWNQKPLTNLLQETYSCPVFIENDSVTGSLGEAVCGNFDKQDFIYLIWGTGIGGAKVFSIKNSMQSEQLLPWKKYFSEWEKDCGGKSIQKKFGKHAGELPEKIWTTIINNFIKHLEIFLNKQPTSLIVLSGGVALNNPTKITEINKQIAKKYPVSLVVSNMGENANLLGAFYLLQKLLNS